MIKSKNDYYNKRDRNNLNKADKIIVELPDICDKFFVGIEQRTSALTRLNYAYDLRVFFQFLSIYQLNKKKVEEITVDDLRAVTAFDIEKFLNYLNNYETDDKMHTCSESGKKRYLSTVRAFFKYLYNMEILEQNVASKVAMPKLHEKPIIRLEQDEVELLLDNVESGNGLTKREAGYHEKTKVRDNAIITLFLGTGIRISELVGLDIDDFDFDINAFSVTRKGGGKTILYYPDEVKFRLYDYFKERDENEELPKEEHAAFLSIQNKRISVRAVENLVKKYAGTATPLKRISPHKLRSTFGTRLYHESGDIYKVADFLGHKDINTTKKHYAAITDESRREVAETVKLRKDNNDKNDDND